MIRSVEIVYSGAEVIICPKCVLVVNETDDCFECDLCLRWYHISCLNICKDVHDAINVMNKVNEELGVVGDCIKINCSDCQSSPAVLACPPKSQPIINSGDSILNRITQTIEPGDDACAVTQQPFKVVQGTGCSLSNFFPCVITVDGVEFRSSEHAYQYMCAQRQGLNRLAEDIKNAPTAANAKKLSHQMRKSASKGDKISLMWELLVQKAIQCDIFLKDLIACGSATILHSTGPRDKLWGTGLNPGAVVKSCSDYNGENVFGRLLMDLRSVLLGLKDDFLLSDYAVPNVDLPVTRSCNDSSTGGTASRGHGCHQGTLYRKPLTKHSCYHCGVPGHVKRVCRLKNRPVVCDTCKQTGHKKKYCKSGSSAANAILPTINLCSRINVFNPSVPPPVRVGGRVNSFSNVVGAANNMCVPSAYGSFVNNVGYCGYGNNIASTNFMGNIQPSAAISTIRSFSGFPVTGQSF